jgi:lipoyl synthase
MKFRKPLWIDKKVDFKAMHRVEGIISDLRLHTVCSQARCPNISECFGRGNATFLIMGDICTRRCVFCGVGKGAPEVPDPDEPGRICEAVKRLGLRHVVITSVTRDDLVDGGASVFAAVTDALRMAVPAIKIEVLTPDFLGMMDSVDTVLAAGPDIFGHNVETVPSLYRLRPGADYGRSLGLLEHAAGRGALTKSAIMLGLGESEDEVIRVMRDLRGAGCGLLSLGQYLQPGAGCVPVREYYPPDRFDCLRETALGMGFSHVESGVYARSSWHAEAYLQLK